jgi:hypothetical protein
MGNILGILGVVNFVHNCQSRGKIDGVLPVRVLSVTVVVECDNDDSGCEEHGGQAEERRKGVSKDEISCVRMDVSQGDCGCG